MMTSDSCVTSTLQTVMILQSILSIFEGIWSLKLATKIVFDRVILMGITLFAKCIFHYDVTPLSRQEEAEPLVIDRYNSNIM